MSRGSKDGMRRSPTFLVKSEKQRGILEEFQRRDQQFTEEYQKNKPLCFSAKAYQDPHPAKVQLGYKDADATRTSPMLLGVCDGVSQLEDYDIDASLLPQELLQKCEDLAMAQLVPDGKVSPHDCYRGPIALLKEAYEATSEFGSTTVLLAALDNSTVIHGKLHPMIAVLSIGDCELLMLRRTQGRKSDLVAVFQTEMQRIDGHMQTPLQLARVDERIDAEFDESIAYEVIEKGSAVHCVSAYEGDVIVVGSDGVFDNLFVEEVVEIVNDILRPPKSGQFSPASPEALDRIARRIVREAHAKSGEEGMPRSELPITPIGNGGKVDDTSVVVGEVVEWTQAHRAIWAQVRREKAWENILHCGGIRCGGHACQPCGSSDEEEEDDRPKRRTRTRGLHQGRAEDEDTDTAVESDEEDEWRCHIL